MLFGLQLGPSTFFFVNFDFSYFFWIFLKTKNINIDLMRKIGDL